MHVVVPIRNEPPLSDIAGRLRHLADEIERGEWDVESCVVMLAGAREFAPATFCFGDNPDRHWLSGVFLHAAQRTLTDREE